MKTVKEKKYDKSAAQVALKWNAQRGVSIIPKSVHVERMEQNIDIWDANACKKHDFPYEEHRSWKRKVWTF